MSLDIEGVLSAHVPLGDDAEGIEQCSCGAIAIWRRDDDDVRYLATHAEGPDLRWHVAHVAAIFREQIDGAVRAEREGFLPSAGLSPAWIAGWHSAADHIAAHLSDTERAGDAE